MLGNCEKLKLVPQTGLTTILPLVGEVQVQVETVVAVVPAEDLLPDQGVLVLPQVAAAA